MPTAALYEYADYKKFVNGWIRQAPNNGRGLRKSLAEAIGCQTPFITHVLSGTYHFSLEQAEACGRWMKLSEDEIEFLLLLTIKARAGTKALEKLAAKQIASRRERHAVLKSRVKIQESLSRDDQALYYSSAVFALVHMAVLIPACQTVEGLCTNLRLPPPRILRVLEFLVTRGLIKCENRRYTIQRPMIHLEGDSPLIRQHLSNWRLKAMDEPVGSVAENLHYSGVMSLSQDDFEWLREKLSSLLEETVEKLKSSKDEKLACLNFDCFALT